MEMHRPSSGGMDDIFGTHRFRMTFSAPTPFSVKIAYEVEGRFSN
jgi:hypothetical protein